MHPNKFASSRAGFRVSLLHIVALLLVVALGLSGQTLSDINVADGDLAELIVLINEELRLRNIDPNNRASISEADLAVATFVAKGKLGEKAKARLVSEFLSMRPAGTTKDSSAQDWIDELINSPANGATPQIRGAGEPPRAAAASHNIAIVGFGQATTGFNFRALISRGQTASTAGLTTTAVTGFPASAVNTFLTGSAADGSIAVGYYTTINPTANVPFFMSLPSGTPTALPLAAGDVQATPAKVSADGAFIAGTTFQTNTDPQATGQNSRIVRWTRTGNSYAITTIGGFPGRLRTFASTISSDGSAIAGNYLDAQNNTRPILWTQAGGFKDLGTLPGQSTGSAIGLNKDGSIVVGSSGQAFVWTAADGMKPLRAIANSGLAIANAVTPNGKLIAGASYDGGFGNPIAHLWTSNGETIKIRDLLLALGVDVTGWNFYSIFRIIAGANGSYSFVGNGSFNGVDTGFAFVLSIPSGPPPTITRQPQAQAAAAGGAATFSVAATGATGYQWQRNGTAIAGATNATLTLTNAQAANAGNYTVVVSNSDGSVTSTPAALTVAPTVARLTNVSVRTTAGTGANILIVGFTLGGGGKNVLLRAVGPTLGTFGVPGTLDDPRLALFTGTGAQTAQNDDWGGGASLTSAFDAVGAFRLPTTSKDAVLLNSLAAGGYTAQVSGAANTSGVVLLEAYDSDAGSPLARYTNLSARNQVGTGGNILIVGFNIVGNGPKNLLIRAVGPSLAQFGVAGVLADPQLAIFNAAGAEVNRNDDWGGGGALANASTSVGAFALPATSKDAALSVTLQPGSYTAQVSGVANSTGVALAEIYELP